MKRLSLGHDFKLPTLSHFSRYLDRKIPKLDSVSLHEAEEAQEDVQCVKGISSIPNGNGTD